jgi:hypothetical protein
MFSYSRCHLPALYIGMECMRTHSYKLAEQVYTLQLQIGYILGSVGKLLGVVGVAKFLVSLYYQFTPIFLYVL